MGGAQIMVCTSPSGEKIGKLMGGLKVGGTLLVLACEFVRVSVDCCGRVGQS